MWFSEFLRVSYRQLMSACEQQPSQSAGDNHPVHFYGTNTAALIRSVGAYMREGLERGERGILITRPDRIAGVCGYLRNVGFDPEALIAQGDLQFLDADLTLDRFMVGGQPDAARFDAVVGSLVRTAMSQGGFCAYGEMVDLLWARGQFPAAVRLEQLWHRLLLKHSFRLLCSYGVDLLDPTLELGMVEALLCAHTHLLPGSLSDDLATALHAAITEIMGERSGDVLRKAAAFAPRGWLTMPPTEALVLYLHKNGQPESHAVLERASARYRVRGRNVVQYSSQSAV